MRIVCTSSVMARSELIPSLPQKPPHHNLHKKSAYSLSDNQFGNDLLFHSFRVIYVTTKMKKGGQIP